MNLKHYQNLLSIDPSLRKTGYAVWTGPGELKTYGLLRTDLKIQDPADVLSNDDLEVRLLELAKDMRDLVIHYRCGILAIEKPKYFKGTMPNRSVETRMKYVMAYSALLTGFQDGSRTLKDSGVIKRTKIWARTSEEWKSDMPKANTKLYVDQEYAPHMGGILKEGIPDVYDAIHIGDVAWGHLGIREAVTV